MSLPESDESQSEAAARRQREAMPQGANQKADDALLERLETMLAGLERLKDVREREQVRDAVRAVLELHRVGLERILAALTNTGAAGHAALSRLGNDALVSSLMALHDIHPAPLEARVKGAIDKVQPFLKLNGHAAELTLLSDDAVKVKLSRATGPMHTTPEKLRGAISQALLEAAPDAAPVEIQDA